MANPSKLTSKWEVERSGVKWLALDDATRGKSIGLQTSRHYCGNDHLFLPLALEAGVESSRAIVQVI